MGKRLSRDEFLSGKDLVTEDVDVPELGGTVRVTELSVGEMEAFYGSFPADVDGKRVAKLEHFREKLLSFTVVDEAGNRLFIDDDIPALGKKSLKVVQRLFEVAQRLNGMAAEKDAIEKK